MDPRPDQDPMLLRISDAERHQVAEHLRRAAGEGRLDLGELDERLEATYAAKTYADLVPLLADLPGHGGLPVLPPAAPRPPAHPDPAYPAASQPGALPGALPAPSTSSAVLSGCDRRGAWLVGPTHTAFALMGGVTLDLRQAQFATREVVVNASAIMGSVDLTVNAGTRVVVEGTGIMGSFEEGRARTEPDLRADSPVVRVRGLALMGAVTVVRKPMPGEPRRRLGRRP